MKKTIVIISYAYPPINAVGGLRAYAIARNLDASKYNIVVITSKPNKDIANLDAKKDLLSNTQEEQVKLLQIGSYIGNTQNQNSKSSKNTIKSFVYKVGKNLIYPDKGVFWSYEVRKYLSYNKDIVEQADIILSTSPVVSSHNIARFIKSKNPKVKWIADFRDFYYIENIENDKNVKSLFHKRLERKIVEEADELVFVTETMLKSYKNNYFSQKNKMKAIYNGFDGSLESQSYNFSKNKKVSFFYAGSFYDGLRSPIPLLKLLDKAFENDILSKSEVVVRIAGNIDENTKADIKRYSSAQCIEYLGFISREEALTYMHNSTFLWLIVANIKSHYQTVPAKIFEYIAARRPIISFSPIISEASEIIGSNNLGCNFDTSSFSIEESYRTFEDLIEKYRKGCFSQPLDSSTLEKFSWDNQILLFESIL